MTTAQHRQGKKHCQWLPEDMEKALEACCGEQKLTATEASHRFSVPCRTLTDRLKNKVKDSIWEPVVLPFSLLTRKKICVITLNKGLREHFH